MLDHGTPTLVMTAQEEDFERGNSSKDGRADGPDDDDHGRPMTSRQGRRGDVIRRLVALVENVPNLLKLPAVMATTRLEK
jgi:hypothetical protein